jgi:glycosyltransferase involved in cell wall biosynthesis
MAARICMIAYTDYAGDTRVRREAEALVARGDLVHVICPQPEGRADVTSMNGVTLVPRGRLDYEPRGPLAYILRYLRFVVRAGATVSRYHARYRYDVVQVHTMPDFLVFATLLPKLFGAGVLIDVHDLVPELYASKFARPESHPVIKVAKWVERQSVAFADRALAVHGPHLDALVDHGNPREKFEIVMNAPDPDLFRRQSAEPTGPFTLVYHGTIARRHGLEFAVRAVGIARKSCPDLRLEIVGDGDDVERIEHLIKTLDLADCVSISRGIVPVEELEPILARANAGIVPIVDDSFTRYMLPVKLLEYVALGLPVLCTRTDTIQAYFDDSDVAFFDSGDVAALAARIVELRENPQMRAGMVENATHFFRQHSWFHERQRYFDVVESLLPEARRARAGRPEPATADSTRGSHV